MQGCGFPEMIPTPNSKQTLPCCLLRPWKPAFAWSPSCKNVHSLSQMLCIPQYGDATLNILTSSAVASAGSDTSSIFSDIFSTSEVLENNKWHSCTSALSKRSPESGQIIQRFFSAIWEAFPASFLSHSQPLATWRADVCTGSCGSVGSTSLLTVYWLLSPSKPQPWQWGPHLPLPVCSTPYCMSTCDLHILAKH